MEYLDFELPIKELEDQLDKCQIIGQESDVDVSNTCKQIEKKLEETKKKIYKNLTAWQRVQLSRHPNRPYTLEHITNITNGTFLELFGDRNFKDDKAMIGGLGQINGQSYMIIGQQKGINTKMRQYRNFGMANPEGYRKALRLMKMAEKFNLPVLTLIDTPGAYPGLEAEERGQGEAIARNLMEMSRLKTPIISIVIGEGSSGGALGICVGDKIAMLENSVYSVLSPEGFASILYKDSSKNKEAAEKMKITAKDLKELGIIDDIIKEKDNQEENLELVSSEIKKYITKTLKDLNKLKTEDLLNLRYEKYRKIGKMEE